MMKSIRRLVPGAVFACTFGFGMAYQAALGQSAVASPPEEVQAMIQAITSTPPLPASQAPAGGVFWSAQFGDQLPPFPINLLNLPFWDLGGGTLIYDDRDVVYPGPQDDTLAGAAGAEMDSIRSPGNVFDPNGDAPCNPGGPVYLTNVVAFPSTNGTVTVSFAIQGGASGMFYDIFASTNLTYSLAGDQWAWVGQGLTCNAYTFSNQPAGMGFYILAQPSFTAVYAWGDNSYGECNVPASLTNAIAVAAGRGFSLALRVRA